jgi:hypothetical protein
MIEGIMQCVPAKTCVTQYLFYFYLDKFFYVFCNFGMVDGLRFGVPVLTQHSHQDTSEVTAGITSYILNQFLMVI